MTERIEIEDSDLDKIDALITKYRNETKGKSDRKIMLHEVIGFAYWKKFGDD